MEWFHIEKIDNETFAISEYGHWEEPHCYLLLGTERAVLIDTGLGVANIKSVVNSITFLPVLVINCTRLKKRDFEMGKKIKALEIDVAKRKEKLTAYHAYAPDEMFHHKGQDLFSVLDFWRYAYGQLEGLADTLAEFFVAKALEIEKAENVNYWTAYDMAYRNKRIEVKATSYVHPWNTSVSKVRTFSIEPTNNSYWGNSAEGVNGGKKLSRQSEVYVFCLNSNMDIHNNDPLNVDDWIFYVVPTFEINIYCKENPNQKKISLNVVRRLAKSGVAFHELRNAVDAAIEKSDNYYEEL